VRPERFELPTYCSGGTRSIHLSYGRTRGDYTYLQQLGSSGHSLRQPLATRCAQNCAHLAAPSSKTASSEGWHVPRRDRNSTVSSDAGHRPHITTGLPPASGEQTGVKSGYCSFAILGQKDVSGANLLLTMFSEARLVIKFSEAKTGGSR
jgi:hypothetical protein